MPDKNRMRYSRYYTKKNPDGSRSVLRLGPASSVAATGPVRIFLMCFVGAAGLLALFSGAFAAFGVLLLLFALVMPNYRKRRKT